MCAPCSQIIHTGCFRTLIYVCGIISHTAVFIDERKITENCLVNSFTKYLVVRRTTRPFGRRGREDA